MEHIPDKEFKKKVKCALIDRDKTQTWLAEEVTRRTGQFCDTNLIGKIYRGVLKVPTIRAAINEILEL